MSAPSSRLHVNHRAARVLTLAIVIMGAGLAISLVPGSRLSKDLGVGAESRSFSIAKLPQAHELRAHCESVVVDFLERADEIPVSSANEFLDRWRAEAALTISDQPAGVVIEIIQPIWLQDRTTFGWGGLLTETDATSGEAGQLNERLFADLWGCIEEQITDSK